MFTPGTEKNKVQKISGAHKVSCSICIRFISQG